MENLTANHAKYSKREEGIFDANFTDLHGWVELVEGRGPRVERRKQGTIEPQMDADPTEIPQRFPCGQAVWSGGLGPRGRIKNLTKLGDPFLEAIRYEFGTRSRLFPWND
jgi:hypothetical protein